MTTVKPPYSTDPPLSLMRQSATGGITPRRSTTPSMKLGHWRCGCTLHKNGSPACAGMSMPYACAPGQRLRNSAALCAAPALGAPSWQARWRPCICMSMVSFCRRPTLVQALSTTEIQTEAAIRSPKPGHIDAWRHHGHRREAAMTKDALGRPLQSSTAALRSSARRARACAPTMARIRQKSKWPMPGAADKDPVAHTRLMPDREESLSRRPPDLDPAHENGPPGRRPISNLPSRPRRHRRQRTPEQAQALVRASRPHGSGPAWHEPRTKCQCRCRHAAGAALCPACKIRNTCTACTACTACAGRAAWHRSVPGRGRLGVHVKVSRRDLAGMG